MPTNNEGVIFKQWVDPEKNIVARGGDWICAPFQCNHCWFQNILKRNPDLGSPSDKQLLHYIRSVHLDILWAKAKSTVQSLVTGLNKGIRMSKDLGIPPLYPPQGPCHIQDDLYSIYANVIDSFAYAQAEGMHFNGGRGASYNIIQHPTHLALFQLFMTGLEQCMG
eukprot:13527668-Ditylum_brightwellii.AAC.1